MADIPHPDRLSLPLAPLVAGVIAVLTAAMFALVPTELLESMVVDSGIASLVSAAEPPLGITARACLVLVCGGGVGLVAWFALFLLFGGRTIVLQRSAKADDEAPVLRRADAHPDAPARRPLFANTDLGTPFLEVRAKPVHLGVADIADGAGAVDPVAAKPVPPRPTERALPQDLDQPLSAFDPAAVPDTPIAWSAAEPEPAEPQPQPLPRRQTFDANERFETFPLNPPVPAPTTSADSTEQPLPIRQAPRDTDPSDTIHALLDRLERVVSRRETEMRSVPAPAPETIADSLSVLRRMATGGN